ncbi:MAG: hypothetical protein JSR27_00235 [Proteobacteria bacterium]|nr:hypothetical protein [Pseudomonadota bacterium]
MSKYENAPVRTFALVGCTLAALLCAGEMVNATSASRASPQPCAAVTHVCVPFGARDIKDSHNLKRANVWGVADPSVWNTTAPVTLTMVKKEPLTHCKSDPLNPPMNQKGASLFIEENRGQHMYLIYNNEVLWRQLLAAHRSSAEATDAVVWLEGEMGKGTSDPYDYFVEFDATPDKLKTYRVESFPHLASFSNPTTLCDCERPDVMIPDPAHPIDTSVCSSGLHKKGIGESSTGEGNEPGHQ